MRPLRDVIAVRGVLLIFLDTVFVPLAVVTALVARAPVSDVAVRATLAPLRTAASAVPIQKNTIARNAQIFFILVLLCNMLSKYRVLDKENEFYCAIKKPPMGG